MKYPLSAEDASAITETPEVSEMSDDELRRELKSAEDTVDEQMPFIEAAHAELRRRAGPETALGFAYMTKGGQIDPATVGGTEQMAMVNALWCHGNVAVTNTADIENITQAFLLMCGRVGGKLVKVKITEVPEA